MKIFAQYMTEGEFAGQIIGFFDEKRPTPLEPFVEVTEAQRANHLNGVAEIVIDLKTKKVRPREIAKPPLLADKFDLVQAMRAAGVWDAVKAAWQADEDAKYSWDAAPQIIPRDHPMIVEFADSIGIDPATVDAIFESASGGG